MLKWAHLCNIERQGHYAIGKTRLSAIEIRRTDETTAEISADFPFRLSVSKPGVVMFNSL